MAQREGPETSRQALEGSKTPSCPETGKCDEKTTPRTPNTRYLVMEWIDQSNQSIKKRRRADIDITPETTKPNRRPMREKLITLLNKVDKETLQLYKLCTDNNNTKREIKDTAMSLRSLMSQIMTREMQIEIATIRNEETPKTDEKKESSGTCVRCKKDIQAEDNLKDEIKQMLDEAITFEEYWTAASAKWPEGVFITTKLTSEDKVKKNHATIHVLDKEETQEYEKTMTILREKHAQLRRNTIKNKIEEGTMITIKEYETVAEEDEDQEEECNGDSFNSVQPQCGECQRKVDILTVEGHKGYNKGNTMKTVERTN
ncbi:hypothetical protein FQR65_LT17358 [Abscondita terminalis]|nr:hypothetical protein FQR65_LT17358 [Abscondita terminalis]